MNCGTVEMNSLRKIERRVAAFTLIELLVVISVIAILTAMVLGTAHIAVSKMRRSRVETERDALRAFIDAYKNKFGSYPPDNPNNPAINPLFYELTGTVLTGGDTTNLSLVTHDTFTQSQ